MACLTPSAQDSQLPLCPRNGSHISDHAGSLDDVPLPPLRALFAATPAKLAAEAAPPPAAAAAIDPAGPASKGLKRKGRPAAAKEREPGTGEEASGCKQSGSVASQVCQLRVCCFCVTLFASSEPGLCGGNRPTDSTVQGLARGRPSNASAAWQSSVCKSDCLPARLM